MSLPRTPLHAWLGAKLGLPAGQGADQSSLEAYQLARLREVARHVREHSPWYRERLAGLPEGFPARLRDWARVPLSGAEDLRQHHLAMLCVSQGEVARVVTLRTSGTSAAPKRVYFSQADLELTLDFFHHGMATLVGPGDTVLILLPGRTPDSVGDLLARALGRLGVRGLVHGPVREERAALEQAAASQAACLVGIPVQVLALAEHPQAQRLRGMIKSVLLTTDYVPRALAQRVRRAWGCEVFEHYGMTETGLGGGVDCAAHQGYHLRGADLYYEMVDPASGEPLPPGQEGELVVTTLTRQAMPMLRYRTGDLGSLLPGLCPCGGFGPRLSRVPGRRSNRLDLGQGVGLSLWDLDEALLALPGVLDFRAALRQGGGSWRLDLTLRAVPGAAAGLAQEVPRSLTRVAGLAGGRVTLGPLEFTEAPWPSDGTGKRTLAT